MVDWKNTVRTLGAILSIAGLFWASLQAPFFHIHHEELDHSSAFIPVHLHIHLVREAPGAAIFAETADDDAIETEWSISQPQSVTTLGGMVPAGNVWVPSPVFSSAVVPVPNRRGHDPPDLTPKQPRSPPA